jgi:lysozyme family protein
MSADPFLAAFSRTMEAEGGYTESGPTYRGIDRRFWPGWPGWMIVDDWRGGIITEHQRDTALVDPVRDFYRTNFWHRIRGNELAALDLELACRIFDAAVNCGVHQAVKFLQTAINRLNRHGQTYPDIPVDGLLGTATMHTLRRQLQTTYGGSTDNARRLLLTCYTGEQYRHYASLAAHESWPGWFLRLRWSV